MNYNKGNLQKYNSKNPLKQIMLDYFKQKVLKEILELNLQSPKILDAGCGEGFMSEFLYNNLKTSTIDAFDFSEQAIAYAKEHCSKEINFSTDDIYKIEKQSNNYDLVCCFEVLEHLKEPKKALQQLLKSSSKYILISVPHEPWFCLGNLLSGKNITRLGNPIDHINHYTTLKLKKFIKQNTPQDIEIKLINCFVWNIVLLKKHD